ncbi:MAG: hypothetical protein IGS49_19205 [Chlorogloeopsis fritschii C42_A2020_084]|uniref:hypothetical protein n=1 Tax=Chlorogloeopsis fritschii TaxID=1124 RepID=UPI0019EC15A9|nr:hypothetical protein [Chlorogloeopsis fritschii]MBF2007522.1 hypothetical protein [Chlorogloeopsis fritschii C42_A2020_084]
MTFFVTVDNLVQIYYIKAKLRAELDGMIAHLYGLTEEEFAYILTTFPLVPEQVKQDALEAYRTFAIASNNKLVERSG